VQGVRAIAAGRVRAVALALALGCALSALGSGPAHAAEPGVQPYQHDDYGGFRDILPPGTNGFTTLTDIGLFLANGQRPAHNNDQLGKYASLLDTAPGVSAADVAAHFKQSSFGVKPSDVARTYHPGGRDDVTVLRDRSYGVPHVYGATRPGAMFALGYVAAEDRLFFIDVLRHAGRAQLSSFAGGAPGNRAMDEAQWLLAPYTEADLQRQYDQGDDLYGDDGRRVQDDANAYVAGVNAYIDEAKLDPTKMPGEYAAIGKPAGPDPWRVTDIIATASLVGGIFGKGGGQELGWAQLLQGFQKKFGDAQGLELFRQFSGAHDPEANTTVHNREFSYEPFPQGLPSSAAMPDPGSVQLTNPVESGVDSKAGGAIAASQVGAGAKPKALRHSLRGLLALPRSESNALVVSRDYTQSGHPVAVFGPQVAYFAPEILMEQDVHAPGIDARGASFPGVNLYVELGRGRDYSWSATSAGQDIIDTYALELCDPEGGAPSQASTSYLFHGQCVPMEILHRNNAWVPSAADQTGAGSQVLRAERTKLGIVIGRAEIGGRPVAYTSLRSTYFHEVDSAGGFSDFNDPDKMHNVQDFQRAAYKIGYTFNWFYADDQDIGYFNSGNNPVRPAGLDPLVPTKADFEWEGLDPSNNTAHYTPADQHPQAVDQQFLSSWNNKQARGYAGAPTNIFNSVYRSQLLDDRIRGELGDHGKITPANLVEAMEDAATVDIRGDKILPYALRVIGAQSDPALAAAVDKLSAWQRSGSHRIDRDHDGHYDQADAVQIMDAWWPKLLHAEFEPVLGKHVFDRLESQVQFDNSPNNHGDHLGSAYQDGWYGYANKDLRQVLGDPVSGPFAQPFCGNGDLTACRAALVATLRDALGESFGTTYPADPVCPSAPGAGPDMQSCRDKIRFRPLGGITQPLIPWQNRPTYQQVIEIPDHRPR
jgi:acyl-homoserine lactone acylase PvdQ